MSKEQNLNDMFARLSALGIEVLSMRNKVNRLEEIFMRLVETRRATGRLRGGAAAQRPRRSLPDARQSLRGADQSRAHPLDRLQDHRHSRVRPHHPHLGPDDRAVGGDGDAVFRDLRQPHRPARRPDGRLRLHAVHRPRPHHDVRHHELLRERGVLVLRCEVRQARRGDAGLAAAQLDHRVLATWQAAWCAG